MSELQKKHSAVWTLLGLFIVSGARAELPVIDFTAAVNAAQELESWAEQAKQMQQEITTMTQQLQQIQMLYTSVTGGPNTLTNLAKLGNNATFYQYLPNDYQQVLQSGYAGWQTINEANQIADPKFSGLSGTGLQTLTQRAMQISSNVGMMQQAYSSAAQRISNLQTLLNQVDSTPDAKSIQDLQGRIQAEQTLLQNEQTRLQLIGQLADLQRDQEVQKAQQSAIAATGGQIPTGW
jgi:type IV secretion system protein VirB5